MEKMKPLERQLREIAGLDMQKFVNHQRDWVQTSLTLKGTRWVAIVDDALDATKMRAHVLSADLIPSEHEASYRRMVGTLEKAGYKIETVESTTDLAKYVRIH